MLLSFVGTEGGVTDLTIIQPGYTIDDKDKFTTYVCFSAFYHSNIVYKFGFLLVYFSCC